MMKSAQRGFTLIELMIVAVIAGILAAIVYPSYLEQTRKTRRAEAKSALMQAMMQQERFYTQNSAYMDFTLGPPAGFKTYSGDNAASSAYLISGADCSGNLRQCIQLSATVNAEKFTDDTCHSLSLTSTGDKSAKKKDGSDNKAECWK